MAVQEASWFNDDLERLGISSYSNIGCAIAAGSPAVCPASASLGRHDSVVRLSSRCVCKKRTAQRTEWKALSYQCCKLFLQQEMEQYKYLINVQRIALKFEHSHSFSMSFSVF